jgi:hypothetical protein
MNLGSVMLLITWIWAQWCYWLHESGLSDVIDYMNLGSVMLLITWIWAQWCYWLHESGLNDVIDYMNLGSVMLLISLQHTINVFVILFRVLTLNTQQKQEKNCYTTKKNYWKMATDGKLKLLLISRLTTSTDKKLNLLLKQYL